MRRGRVLRRVDALVAGAEVDERPVRPLVVAAHELGDRVRVVVGRGVLEAVRHHDDEHLLLAAAVGLEPLLGLAAPCARSRRRAPSCRRAGSSGGRARRRSSSGSPTQTCSKLVSKVVSEKQRLAALRAKLAEVVVVALDDGLLDRLHRARLVEHERHVEGAVMCRGVCFRSRFLRCIFVLSFRRLLERLGEEPKLIGGDSLSVLHLADVRLRGVERLGELAPARGPLRCVPRRRLSPTSWFHRSRCSASSSSSRSGRRRIRFWLAITFCTYSVS